MVRPVADAVVINRMPEEVFDTFADGRTYQHWLPGAKDVELLTPEPVGPNSAFRGRFKGVGALRWETVEYDRPHRIVQLGHAPIGDMRHIVTFEATDGATRVLQRGEGELKGIFRLLRPLMTPLVERMMSRNWRLSALGLKQYLERDRAS